MVQRTLPLRSPDSGLTRYLNEIRAYPLLTDTEEFQFARDLRDHGDREAAHRLITSHLRLVAKIAMGFRGYGLPIGDIISEGNVGLMQAVKRFDPERGFRLATYAMWWIKAAIQEYVLRSWSLVKLGTTASQKRLFFNLRRVKSQISALDEGDMHPEQVKDIARQLDVPERDVVLMNRRLGGDKSLNVRIGGENGESNWEWQDWLADDSDDQEVSLANRDELSHRVSMMNDAIESLSERERIIFRDRQLKSPARTLENLSGQFGVSRERIRQIDVRAFEKVRDFMRAVHASSVNETLADDPT